MMGELVRNEVDMGLGNVFMMGYRYEVITFSAPFSHEVRDHLFFCSHDVMYLF